LNCSSDVLACDENKFLIKGYKYIRQLENIFAFKLHQSGQEIILEFDKLKFSVQTLEDLFILNEVYNDGVYNIIDKTNCCVIDIGMNVGFSSIFFARIGNVQKVVSFEPFKPTYQQALRNFNLNSEVKNKISTFNYGLGDRNEILELDYIYNWKGSVGVDGIPKQLISNSDLKKEQIEIKTTAILDTLIELDNESPIGIKIDCEGAEYAILPLLVNLKVFTRVKWILMEWHFKGPDFITELLNANGFSIVSLNPNSKGAGTIYAFRTSN
jgi:FkbM family methyltransferase